MAGHSKWANIQHRKNRQDEKRGKVWTKIIREVSVAARVGGGDVATNPRLRLAIEKAADANMPKDNVQRAIAKAAVQQALDLLKKELAEGHGKATPKAAADLRQALKEHVRYIEGALEADAHATLTAAGELEGWQRWRAD